MNKIVIIGKTGAGKSTLFNKITESRLSLVSSEPNSTTDYISINQRDRTLIDSCGFEIINNITQEQIDGANILIYVVKGSISDSEKTYIQKLRRTNKKLILYLNRSYESKLYHNYFYLFDAVFMQEEISPLREYINWNHQSKNQLLVGLVGAINSGKSTVFNELLGRKRSIIGDDDQGTTTDCIYESYRDMMLVDTAGYGNSNSKLQQDIYTNRDSKVKDFHGIILVLDGSKIITKTDKVVYGLLDKLGCFCYIYVNRSSDMPIETEYFLDKIKSIPIIYELKRLKLYLRQVMDFMNYKLSTPKLNKWFRSHDWALFSNGGKPVKIKYLFQISLNPVEIVYFSRQKLNRVGVKTFKNRFKEHFKLHGIQIILSKKDK